MAIDFEQGDLALADGFAQTIQLGDWPAVGDDDDVARAFTLLPGKYKIKFLARDAETGRMGTFEMRFLVPNLNQELQRIPISPVVLSSQRVDMRESLFNASKGEKGQKAQ